MAWSGARDKSCAFDEIAHLTAGYSYWLTGDYRLHPENGNLPQRLVALPLLASGVRFPDRNDRHWRESNVWELGYTFFYELGNDFRRMLWQARGMIVLLGMVLGGITYVWSRRLFGVAGGLLSLVVYVFCPTLLAHSALATSDLTVTLMFVASLGCFWRGLHKVSPAGVVVSGTVIGLLFVSKMSAVVVLPVFFLLLSTRVAVGRPLIVCWRKNRSIVVGRGRQLWVLAGAITCQAAIVVFLIWLFYGFQPTFFREATPNQYHLSGNYTLESLTRDGTVEACLRFANAWHLLPEPYLYGLAYAVKMSETRVAFLNGEFSLEGFRSFFPYALLVKTPLPTLILLILAALAAGISWSRRSDATRLDPKAIRRRAARGLYRTAPLLIFLAVYWAIAIRSNLNIGHRHILPTYPVMFILCGAGVYWLRNRSRLVRALPLVAVAWLAVESLSIYPHYLAYFNELAGGPRHGYRHLVDSSLDWGQDLPGLKRWLDKSHNTNEKQLPVYLSYFGTGSPRDYGVAVLPLPGYPDWRQKEIVDLRPGFYCISATMLQSVYVEPRGPWSVESEQEYQRLLQAVAQPAEKERQDPRLLDRFDRYRLARLCAFLRLREPDDSVGYSILIYKLSADDLNTALFRPLSDWTESAGRSN